MAETFGNGGGVAKQPIKQTPEEIAEAWFVAWAGFIRSGIAFIWQHQSRSRVLANYDDLKLEADLSEALRLTTGTNAEKHIRFAIVRLVKANPDVRKPEAIWLINEMEALRSTLEQGVTNDEVTDLSDSSHIIKGSAEAFLKAAAKKLAFIGFWSKKKKAKDALEGTLSAAKLLNEFFKLIG